MKISTKTITLKSIRFQIYKK